MTHQELLDEYIALYKVVIAEFHFGSMATKRKKDLKIKCQDYAKEHGLKIPDDKEFE